MSPTFIFCKRKLGANVDWIKVCQMFSQNFSPPWIFAPFPSSHKSHNPGCNGWKSDFIIQTSNGAHSNAIDEQIKLFLVKHFKKHSLLSKLQKLKLYHTENHDFPSRRIASIRTCLKIFLLNQHVLTLPSLKIGRGIPSKFTRSIFVWIFGSSFRQKCTVYGQYKVSF